MAEKVGSVYIEASVDTAGVIQAGKAIAKTADEIAADLQRVAAAAEEAAAEQNKLAIAADNLAKAQSQAAAQAEKAASASQSITQKLQAQRESSAAYIEALRTENDMLGMNQAEINAYRLAKLAASDAEQKVAANLQAQIDAFRQNSAAIEAAKAQTLQNKSTVDQMIAALKEQAATLGMNARQLVLYKAAQAGASTEDKKAIIQSLNQIDNYRKKEEATRKATAALQAESAAAKSASGSMNSLRGSAGQVGFQLQDIAVQAQAGTSAFVILGQQGSQLASAFGTGGAVLGAVIAIASAIGGVLYTSLKNASGAMKELPEEMQKQLEEIKKRYSEIDEASQAAFTQAELGKLNTQYEKQLKVVTDLRSAVSTYSAEAGKGSQGAAVAAGQYAARLKLAEAELLNIGKLQARVGEELAGANVTRKLEDGLSESKTAAEQLAEQLQVAITKLDDGDLAARKLYASQLLNLKNVEMIPPELDKAIERLYELEELEKRKTEQKKEQLQLQRDFTAELDRELQAELAAIDAKNKAQANVSGIIAGGDGSPAAKAAAEAEAKIAVLQRDAAAQLITAEQAAEAIIAVEDQKQAELTRIANEGAEKRQQFAQQATQSTLGAFGDLFGNLADVAKEGGEKTFKQYKMLASAQAAISAALAVTNVLANPLIPYPLNVGLAASVGALAAVQIAKIQGQQYSAGSGKLYGGPVQAGGMYPVTEDGRPEILKQGNRQYLLPGSRGGEVVSNRDMQPAGGGGGIVINYNPTIYAQDADFEAIMAGQPEAVLNAVRMGLASEGRTL